ncbi:HD domain-containing protein [bacterium]|nr:HD domain-containing protein [bacterium]
MGTKPFATKGQVRDSLVESGFWNERVEEALLRAILSHRYHVRDDGTPYLEQHIFPMVIKIIQVRKSQENLENLIILTLLHDAYEKDPHFDLQLIEDFFGKEIAADIESITEEPKRGLKNSNERWDADKKYFEKIRKSSLPVRIVKLESWLNNLQTTEILHDREKYERLVKKAEDFYIPLAQEYLPEYTKELKEEVKRLKRLLGL